MLSLIISGDGTWVISIYGLNEQRFRLISNHQLPRVQYGKFSSNFAWLSFIQIPYQEKTVTHCEYTLNFLFLTDSH